MTQISLLLTLAGISGSMVVFAPHPAKRSSSPVPAPRPAAETSAGTPAPDITWLRSFGSYNVQAGALNPFQNPKGC